MENDDGPTQEEVTELANLAQRFNNAIFKKPINEDEIGFILTNTSNDERQVIKACYEKMFGVTIESDIKDTLSSKLKDLCITIFYAPYEYDAKELYRAFHSFMSDDNVICEIIASRPKWMLDLINEAYNKFYKITLIDDIKKKKTGKYKLFLLACLTNERRKENLLSNEEAKKIVNKMKEKNPKNWSNDVELFTEYFVKPSRDDLIKIARIYKELNNMDLYDTVNKFCSGTCRKLMKAVLYSTITPSEWYAKRAYRAVEGLGTDTNTLNRVVVGRAEIDMDYIRDYYHMERKVDLYDDIIGDTSGTYAKILSDLVGH